MKIISLGHLDVQFCCRKCKTIWEQSTNEMKHDEDNCIYVECPLCEDRIYLKDNTDILNFIRKSKKLAEENK